MSAPGGAARAAAGSPWDRSTTVGRLLGAVDDAGEAVFAPARSHPATDRAAAIVSTLADYGFVWVVLAAAKARRGGAARRRAVLALGAAGISSYLVNRAAKRLAGRQRPAPAPGNGARARLARRPTSTSFPSGHVLAACCAAIALPESRAGEAAALSFASAVAASRVHLQDHHASDVLSGAVVGTLTGLAARALVDRLAPTAPPHARARREDSPPCPSPMEPME